MATRFYLSSTGTVTQTPGFAAWTRTTEGLRRSMSPTKDASAITSTTMWANGSAAANDSALARQFVSAPMSAGVAFATSDTIKAQARCNESAINDNVNRAPIAVKVYSQDGATLRATLLGLGHVGLNTTEWPTALTNKTIANSDALTAGYTTVLGDILVVELGAQVDATGGTTVTATMSFGSASASDLLENETDTAANNPWFEISRTISFANIVTPGVLALTIATFAPTLLQALTPGTLALSLATFAPAVLVTAPIIPATATLSLTTFAPTLTQAITPATAALVLTGLAPVLVQALTPTTAALSIVTFAPLTAGGVVPATASLSLATFAPALAQNLTPQTAALVLTTFAPTLKTVLIPGIAVLVTSTFAPSVLSGNTLAPSTAALVTTTFAPTLLQTIMPTTATLALTGLAPQLVQTVTPAALALTIATFAPTVSITSPGVVVIPGVANLALVTYAPTLVQIIEPLPAVLVTITFAPVVSNAGLQPSTAGLTTTLVNNGTTSVAAVTGTNSTSLVNNGVTST